jgi:ferredoxin
MKVVVDYDLCEANALCMKAAPEIFRVEEDDTLTVLSETVGSDLEAKAQEAARLCPPQAITLEKYTAKHPGAQGLDNDKRTNEMGWRAMLSAPFRFLPRSPMAPAQSWARPSQ